MADPTLHLNHDSVFPGPERPMLGIALRLGAMVVLAIMFTFVKLAGQAGVHVIESLFWRQLTGLPVVIMWLWWNNDLHKVKTKQPMAHALRMLIGLTAMLMNFLAMTMLPLAQATTIGFASPIFATLLAAVLLKEATGRYRWGAVLLGFAGILIAIRPGSNDISAAGAIIAICGAILTAGVAIQLRRMARGENTGAIVFWFSLSSLFPLGIAMLLYGKAHDGNTWSLIAGLSISGAIAQILLTSSLRHAPVAAILTMDYSALIWSIFLGYWAFDDIPGHNIWFGAPIIIGAGLLIAWREHYLARRKLLATAQ
jgi:drug/metabolite transporter (DMT)-like permease